MNAPARYDPAVAAAARQILQIRKAVDAVEREACERSIFYLCKYVLGYPDLDEALHGPILLEWQEEDGAREGAKLALFPRGHLKTTTLTIGYCLWRIITTKGRCRILLANATLTNAKGFLRAIRDHLEGKGASRFALLYPEYRPYDAEGKPIHDKWTEEALTVPRDINVTEPTLTAVGLGGNLVSAHYTDIIYDDIVNLENTSTPGQIEKTANWYKASVSLKVPKDFRRRIVGTRWHWADLYGTIEEEATMPVIKRACVRCPSCGNNDGTHINLPDLRDPNGQFTCAICSTVCVPILPSLHSIASLRSTLREQGSQVFGSQYLMNPTPSGDAKFRPEWLMYYTCDLPKSRNELPPGYPPTGVTLRDLNIYTTIDPSVGATKDSDDCVFITCGWHPSGRIYILEIVADKFEPRDVVTHIFRIHRQWRPIMIAMEGEKYTKVFKPFFQEECMRRGESPYLEELPISTKVSKALRIEALQPYFEMRRFYIRSKDGTYAGLQGPHLKLVKQLLDFPRARHDDCPDCLSMQLQIAAKPDTASADPAAPPRSFDLDGGEWQDRVRKTSSEDDMEVPTEYAVDDLEPADYEP